MKISIVVFLVLLFFSACSIPEELGMPSWESEYKLNVLSDYYSAEDIAEENENLVAVQDSLQFRTNFERSRKLGPIKIVDTEERNTQMSLGEIMPEEFHILHGTQGIVPEFDIVETEKSFDEINSFEEIVFHSGEFNLVITNNSVIWGGNAINDDPMIVHVKNDLTNDILQTIVFEDPNDPNAGDIPPNGGTSQKIIDLSGESYPAWIKLELDGGSRGTDGGTALIDTTQMIDFDMTITDIRADYVLGASVQEQNIEPIISHEYFDIPEPETIGEDIVLKGFSKITFDFNYLPVYTHIQFELIGRNKDGEEKYLERIDGESVTITLAADQQQRKITFDSEEYNINEIVSILPEEFDVNFDPIFVGDGTYVDTLSSSDSLYADIFLKTDLQIQSEGTWIILEEDNDILARSVNVEDFDQDIYDAFSSGNMLLKYLNPSGLNLDLELFVSDSKSAVKEEVKNIIPINTTNVKKFQIAQMDTTSIEYLPSEFTIQQDDLDIFLADSVYWSPRFKISSSGTTTWTGGIGLKSELNLKLKIDQNLIENVGD